MSITEIQEDSCTQKFIVETKLVIVYNGERPKTSYSFSTSLTVFSVEVVRSLLVSE